MLAGAALWQISGADLDAAVRSGAVGEYMSAAARSSSLLGLNLTLWMVGVVLLGVSGVGFARLSTSRPTIASMSLAGYTIGAALALAAFSLWLGLVRGLAPLAPLSAELEAVAAALGDAANTADWIATVLILSWGGGLMAVAGRRQWIPNWLYVWGLIALLAGALSIVALVWPALGSLVFLIVPVGLGWAIAAGIVALRAAPGVDN